MTVHLEKLKTRKKFNEGVKETGSWRMHIISLMNPFLKM